VLTGSFSPGDAVVKFFLMAFGGILSGLVVVWVTGKCNNFLVRRTREEPAIQILISLLIPFAAYLLAEAFHVSGILAAVAAGIAMHYEQLSGPRLPATRMKSSAVWSMLQTTLNGMIFLMLGEQLPHAQDVAGGSQPGRRLFALVSAAVRRGHHSGARSDAFRLGMAVDDADHFSP
jgi:CPA1 family monovalent cation:H+ antiporter